MIRAFHPYPISDTVGALTLDGAESRHLLKSLRVRMGEEVEVFDGKGRVRHGAAVASDMFGLRISVGRLLSHPHPDITLTLAQVLPKGGLFEDSIRTAAEIGANKIIPLTSSRCEVKLSGDRAESKAERWRTIAIESLKQSGNPWLLEIAPVESLAKWLPGALSERSVGIIGSLEDDARPVSAFAPSPAPREIIVLVGPEGDFSPEEYSAARTAGFFAASFGPFVLRAETAALYALVVADQFRRRAAGA